MTPFATLMTSYRERAGMSRAMFSERVEIDRSYLGRLEVGEREPSRSLVERLIDRMELSEDEANALRTTAGFVAPGALYVSRPVLAEIDSLLSADALPDAIATPVRQQLASIARTLSAVIGA